MPERLAQKVLLIGWDAADWKIINPLLDSGLMPTLEKFVNSGAIGNIATLQPPVSPILWNSIATGKLPQKHGIHGFVEPMPDGSGIRPVSSTSRKAKAIWNILTQAGLRANVIGWFASHPAEPIKGVCLTNQFQSNPPRLPDEPWPVPPQSIHPARLEKTLAEFRVHPGEMEGDHLQPFLPRAAEIDQTLPVEQKRLNALRQHLAECASIHATATWVMENEPWDFTAIYYNAIDLLCHHFMPFHPPRLENVSERDFEIYKDVVSGIYRFHDMMLERLLQLAGEDAVVILLSDHGFHHDELRPRGESENDPVAWHRSHGILGLHGPGILSDERIYGSSLLDIAPTILTLFGLPVGEDMDGKALIQAFKTPPKIERIASWENVPGECGMHPPDLQQDPVVAQQGLQQLIDLGYISAPSDDVQKTIQVALDDLQSSQGVSTLNYGDPKEAVEIFKKLFAGDSGNKFYGLLLAQSHFAAGQLAEVRSVLEKLLAQFPDFSPVELMLGSLLLAEGKAEEALKQLRKAEQAAPGLPQLYLRLGGAYLRTRRWPDAERAFRQALEMDGDSAESCHGLSVALLRQNHLDAAAEFALRAVGLQHFFPSAHFQLGATLARLNQPERAALAFEHGLTMMPGAIAAHRYLARLYYRLGNMKKCHEHHEAIAKLKT
ncbi:MAG: tetratricopeptide repeat protein [Verrucomicrobiota bacterium]|nr:tetratricopeptide repeat protein [Verrucomicrobiota bacterium]